MPDSEHELALKLAQALSVINEAAIPVISRDARLDLKERAKLTRQFFKSLGLKGISVRLPTSRNCFWVEIRIPAMDRDDVKSHMVYREKARLAILEILQRAFPKETDESDMMTDYFAPSWIVHDHRYTR